MKSKPRSRAREAVRSLQLLLGLLCSRGNPQALHKPPLHRGKEKGRDPAWRRFIPPRLQPPGGGKPGWGLVRTPKSDPPSRHPLAKPEVGKKVLYLHRRPLSFPSSSTPGVLQPVPPPTPTHPPASSHSRQIHHTKKVSPLGGWVGGGGGVRANAPRAGPAPLYSELPPSPKMRFGVAGGLQPPHPPPPPPPRGSAAPAPAAARLAGGGGGDLPGPGSVPTAGAGSSEAWGRVSPSSLLLLPPPPPPPPPRPRRAAGRASGLPPSPQEEGGGSSTDGCTQGNIWEEEEEEEEGGRRQDLGSAVPLPSWQTPLMGEKAGWGVSSRLCTHTLPLPAAWHPPGYNPLQSLSFLGDHPRVTLTAAQLCSQRDPVFAGTGAIPEHCPQFSRRMGPRSAPAPQGAG